MTGAVVDIASRRVVAPPVAPVVPDSQVEGTIYELIVAVLDEWLPQFSEASAARPHLDRARGDMRHWLGAHR